MVLGALATVAASKTAKSARAPGIEKVRSCSVGTATLRLFARRSVVVASAAGYVREDGDEGEVNLGKERFQISARDS